MRSAQIDHQAPAPHREARAPPRDRRRRRGAAPRATTTRRRSCSRSLATRTRSRSARAVAGAVQGHGRPTSARSSCAARRSASAGSPVSARRGRRRSSRSSPATTSSSSRASKPWRSRNYKPTSPGPSRHVHAGLRRDHQERAREEPARAQAADRPAATTTAASRRASAAAATSSATAWSTSSAPRPACRRRCSAIEYDPNRSARIALIQYVDGEKAYILAPQRLGGRRPGDRGEHRRHQAGQLRCRCRYIPVGTDIHAVELKIGARRADRPLGRHARSR